MSDPPPRRTIAQTRRSWGPGWIWAVPIAAIGVAAWVTVRLLAQAGQTVTVQFDQGYGLKPGGSPVMLEGVKVGQVSKVAIDPGARGVTVSLRIDREDARYLTTGASFWLAGAKIDLSNPASLRGLVAGPQVIFEPGPGAPKRAFVGADRPPPIPGPASLRQVDYALKLQGPVGALEQGAPVTLDGFVVGEVKSVSLAYDPAAATIATPVVIGLSPDRLGVGRAGGDRTALDAELAQLVGHGLRARLVQTPPVIGGRAIELAFATNPPPADLTQAGGLTYIPTAGSDDVEAIAAHADRILGEIDAIPFAAIGADVAHTAARLRRLSASPQLQESLDHLERSLAEIDRVTHEAGPQVAPTVARIRQAAGEADATAAAARRLIAGDPRDEDDDIPAALKELTRAARSMRVLADYMEQHPDALLRGKPKPKAAR